MKSKSLQTTLTTISITTLQLLAGIQIARGLGAYGRGELTLITTWAPVFTVLFSGGIIDALSHKMGQTKNLLQSRLFISSAQLLILLLSLAGIFVGFIFTELVIKEKLPHYSHLAILFLLFIPLANIANMNVALDLARERVGYYNIARIIQSGAYYLAILAAIYFMKDPIPGIVVATLFQCGLPMLFNINSLFIHWTRPTQASLTEMWQSSLPLWPGVFLSFLATQADRLVGTLFLDFRDLGIFHVSQSLSFTGVSVLSLTPYLLILPSASRIEDLHSRQEFVISQISFWNLILFIFSALLIPLAYFGAPLLLGADFRATGLAMAFLVPSHAALMSRMMAGRSLRSIGHSSLLPTSEFLFLILLCVSSIVIYSLGQLTWLTLAIVSFLSSLISTIYFFISLASLTETSLPKLLNLRQNIIRLHSTASLLLSKTNPLG